MRIAAVAVLLIFGVCASARAARSDVVEGNPHSAVKVLIYEDLQEAECARFRAMLDQKILPKYGARVAFIHRDFPMGKHEWARRAAMAARWVYEQDSHLGVEIRRELLAEQDHITEQNLKSWLSDFAARNQLDSAGIVGSLSDERIGALVDQDRQGAVARNISSAPAIFVGGVSFVPPILYEDLARALDDALAP